MKIRTVVIITISVIILNSLTTAVSASQFLTMPVTDKNIQIMKYVWTQENLERNYLSYCYVDTNNVEHCHKGTDYKTSEGTEIRASADGTFKRAIR